MIIYKISGRVETYSTYQRIYRVLQKKTCYIFRSCREKTASVDMALLCHKWHILVNTQCKYLVLYRFYVGIVDVESWGLFSSTNRLSLNRADSLFKDTYVLSHKTRTTNDQTFVKPILEIKIIAETVWSDNLSPSTLLMT